MLESLLNDDHKNDGTNSSCVLDGLKPLVLTRKKRKNINELTKFENYEEENKNIKSEHNHLRNKIKNIENVFKKEHELNYFKIKKKNNLTYNNINRYENTDINTKSEKLQNSWLISPIKNFNILNNSLNDSKIQISQFSEVSAIKEIFNNKIINKNYNNFDNNNFDKNNYGKNGRFFNNNRNNEMSLNSDYK
jgi:hypothetical protein